jgi:pyrroline-5-carboxylate reductase
MKKIGIGMAGFGYMGKVLLDKLLDSKDSLD